MGSVPTSGEAQTQLFSTELSLINILGIPSDTTSNSHSLALFTIFEPGMGEQPLPTERSLSKCVA